MSLTARHASLCWVVEALVVARRLVKDDRDRYEEIGHKIDQLCEAIRARVRLDKIYSQPGTFTPTKDFLAIPNEYPVDWRGYARWEDISTILIEYEVEFIYAPMN